jgi:type III secretion protein Q
MGPKDAAGLNRLQRVLGRRRVSLPGLDFTLQPMAPPRPASGAPDHQAYFFKLGDHAGELGLSPLAEALLLGERRPELLPLALRYALLADALAALVPPLEAALGCRFEWAPPVGPGADAAAPVTAALAASPAAHFNLAPPGQAARCAVHLRLESGAALELLGGLPEGPGPAARAGDRALDALRLPLSFNLGSTRLPLSEVRSIRRGDIVGIEHWRSVGPSIGVEPLVSGASLGGLQALAEGSRITVEPARKDFLMTHPPSAQDTAASSSPSSSAEAPPSPLGRLDALEVVLRFQVGELSISLGDLKSVGPGHVFELPEPLNRSTVRIVAHGNVLGTGHLVAVGDRLGIRVSEFALNTHE